MKKILFFIVASIFALNAYAGPSEKAVTTTKDRICVYDSIESQIKEEPDRLELRFILATAAIDNADTTKLAETINGMLDYARDSNFNWSLSGKKLTPEEAKSETQDSAYEFLSILYGMNYYNILDVCDRFLEVFPRQLYVLTMKGAIAGNRHDNAGAIKIFEEIDSLYPGEPTVMLNLAGVYYLTGQEGKAAEMYEKVIADTKSDDEQRQQATEFLSDIRKPKRDMTPYYFVHQWLSVIAPEITYEDGEMLSSPDFLNSVAPLSGGYRSPFSNDDINVEAVDIDGKTVYVWKLPEPKEPRDALYVAFFPIDGHYKAYAICIGNIVDWEISTSTETSRSTFGRVKRPESAKECAELLKDRGAFSGDITMGEYIQEGYKPRY